MDRSTSAAIRERVRGLFALVLGGVCVALGHALQDYSRWGGSGLVIGCLLMPFGAWTLLFGDCRAAGLHAADWKHTGLIVSVILGGIVGLTIMFVEVLSD